MDDRTDQKDMLIAQEGENVCLPIELKQQSAADIPTTEEHKRLLRHMKKEADWKDWGPYLSERAWASVREDYSPSGDAWNYFPHDHARSRAYRWNEDGLGGFCNRFQNVCLGIALWNGKDPFLKERLFGLSGSEGNHGEDVKEYYYYLDNTPTHSYCKMLYKYPQAEYPYKRLAEENNPCRRGREVPELELIDLGVFKENRYFDVFIEYAKAAEREILCKITAVNRGPDPAPLHVLPHIWFRNTWSWGYTDDRPELYEYEAGVTSCRERHIGQCWYYSDLPDQHNLLFTENDTNRERMYGVKNEQFTSKDAFHDYIVHNAQNAVNPAKKGTKAAAHYQKVLQPGEEFVVRVRFSEIFSATPFVDFDSIVELRKAEADSFYNAIQPPCISDELKLIQRQAFAGLLWSKQFYHYGVDLWLKGDPSPPYPPKERLTGRNSRWRHLYTTDVLSMPDKWEYPWFAAWDLAFHCVPLATVDPEFAKRQLQLMVREWYMHPSGQIPAYEWNFDDVNPPVHAWASIHIYKYIKRKTGYSDTDFLEKMFHKLLLNFTWWVNRKDRDGKNIFEGGFLGLDNIGVFDRSAPLPGGHYLQQADGTAWMGMFCLNMLEISLKLAKKKPSYEDVATKFLEHFIYVAHSLGKAGTGLWDEIEGFYFDKLNTENATYPMKVFSFVGLIPLFGASILSEKTLNKLPAFKRRMEWFIKYRPKLLLHIGSLSTPSESNVRLLSLVDKERMQRVLTRMLDSKQFLSEYGLRSLSACHSNPYYFELYGYGRTIRYEPAESQSSLFGGNSNWRGPIWLPVNYLMIESLKTYHKYYSSSFQVEMPTGSGIKMNLQEVATELAHRLTKLFVVDPKIDRRPYQVAPAFLSAEEALAEKINEAHWRDHVLFYEYFNPDTGAGLGASHQTGWTALVASLIEEFGPKFGPKSA